MQIENGKLLKWEIPTFDGQIKESIFFSNFAPVIIIGKNGSGKSQLLQQFADGIQSKAIITNILANRANVFPNNYRLLNSREVERREFNLQAHNINQIDARYKVYEMDSEDTETTILVSKFIDEENRQARKYKDADGDFQPREITDELNMLLQSGFFEFSIQIDSDQELITASKGSSEGINIKYLSDGERNALSIAMQVLLCDPNQVLLIDEPERHIHRSNVIPFLQGIFSCRDDCSFVVSTHEIGLALFTPEAIIIKTNSCNWKDGSKKPHSWNLNIINDKENMEFIDELENLRTEMNGPMRKILLVEGQGRETSSRDLPLYSVLFNNVSVIPGGGKKDLAKKIISARNRCKDSNQIQFYGLIDRDKYSKEDQKLVEKAELHVLGVHSVESLYVCQSAIDAVAQSITDDEGIPKSDLMKSANKVIDEVLEGKTESWDEYCAKEKMKPILPKIAIGLGIDVHRYKRKMINAVRKNPLLADELRNKVGEITNVL